MAMASAGPKGLALSACGSPVFGGVRSSGFCPKSSSRCPAKIQMAIEAAIATRVRMRMCGEASVRAARPVFSATSQRMRSVATRALPSDSYWITAFQAIGVSVFMALAAVISGIVINIGIEVKAIKEFAELDKQGLITDDMLGGEDADFDYDEASYIFGNQEAAPGSRPARNRPVREDLQEELQEVPSDRV